MNRTFIAILLLLAATAATAEPGTALKADSLRAEPFGDAKVVGALNRGDKLDILEKKSAWLKVKAPKGSGWVRLLSVRRGTAGSSGDTAAVLDLASGRAGTGQVVSTTGVRGLSEEQLKAAKFDEAQVQKLETGSISQEQAQQFAAAGGLAARKLGYLPKPKGDAK